MKRPWEIAVKLAGKMKNLYADHSKDWVKDLDPIRFPNPYYLERVVPKMTKEVPLTVKCIYFEKYLQ